MSATDIPVTPVTINIDGENYQVVNCLWGDAALRLVIVAPEDSITESSFPNPSNLTVPLYGRTITGWSLKPGKPYYTKPLGYYTIEFHGLPGSVCEKPTTPPKTFIERNGQKYPVNVSCQTGTPF